MKQTKSNLFIIAEDFLKKRDFESVLLELKRIIKENLTPSELAYYYLIYSEASLNQGNYNIQDILSKAIGHYKFSSDNDGFARAKLLQGWLYICLGKNFEARETLIEAYTSYKRTDNFEGCSQVLNRLAFVQFLDGAIEEAIYNIEKCIEINNELREIEKVYALKRNLASILFMCGHFNKSLEQHYHLLKNLASLRVNHQYHFYLTYSMATALQGDIKKALQLISKTTEFPDDYKREKAQYYEYLGWIYNLDEQFEKAVDTLKTGIELSMKIAPESALISQSKRLLADAYIGLGKLGLAETVAHEALVVAEKINERVEIAGCYRVFALIEQKNGNREGSREWFKKAMDIFALIKSRYELAVTRYMAAISGFYDNGERAAMLYLAREYFQSEDVHKYVEKIDRELSARPKISIRSGEGDNNCPVFIATDSKMKKIVELAENVAQSDLTILLTGPTGAGKDQLAKYIHYYSGRKGEFVTVNAAAIPDGMVESELFGYRKGAFTGADRDNPGLMAEADGGTFYLNEVADAAGELQAKLLEVIENKTIRPLGGGAKRTIDIRIIAATNHDLEARIRDGKFRFDLFHRLNIVPMVLPALLERAEDIPFLVRHFLDKNKVDISDGNQMNLNEFCRLMVSRNWPGNVRELKGFIDRLNILAGGNINLMLQLAREGELTEREILLKTLKETCWNRHETARILGISEGTVRNRIRQFYLEKDPIA